MKNTRRKSLASKPAKGYKVILLLPDSCICDSEPEKCVVVFNSSIPTNVDYLVKFVSTQKSTFVRADRINDFTLTFNSPSTFPPGHANVSFYHGSNQNLLCNHTEMFIFRPKLESVAMLLSSVTNPISFISSAFKLNENDLVAIDFLLERALKINCPEDFLKLKESSSIQTNNSPGNSQLQCPTLLHFAARHNFIKLCVALLQCPGSSTALDIRNDNGDTPINIAENFGNKELAQIMSDAKNNNGAVKDHDADELYEHMSGETYDRYKEMKDNFDEIYERMSQINETYEPMFRTSSANSRGSVAADRQSVYSTDSAVSSGSTDSKGSLTTTPPPPLPPPSYNRKPQMGNPLINELRKKTQEKRLSQNFDQQDSPPPFYNDYKQSERSSPRAKKALQQCYEQVDLDEELENENELYDVPANLRNNEMEETYDVPPSRSSLNSADHGTEQENTENELYDMPSNRAVTSTNDEAEIYDFPTNRGISYTDEAFLPNSPPVSPRKITQNDFDGSEFYDCPSSIRNESHTDNKSRPVNSGGSSPDQSRLSLHRTPPTKPFRIPGKINGVSSSGLSRSLEQLDTVNDEVYDIVPPLSRPATSEKNDWPPYDEPYQFNRKRNSEPIISTSFTDQTRLGMRSMSENPPPLPPPNLPPRNILKPQHPTPPPVPPPRRQQRPS